jgi:hypothetical protein
LWTGGCWGEGGVGDRVGLLRLWGGCRGLFMTSLMNARRSALGANLPYGIAREPNLTVEDLASARRL